MKKWIVAGAMVFMAVGPSWAGGNCMVYEYQEIKDMTDSELQTQMEQMEASYGANLRESNKWAALQGRQAEEESKKSWSAMVQCREQKGRLWSVKSRRPGFVPPPKPTFEKCVQELSSKGIDTEPCKAFPKEPPPRMGGFTFPPMNPSFTPLKINP